MCGIFGIYSVSLKEFDSSNFKKALLKMNHRGPDAHAIKEYDKRVLFGHLRLSIIDLKEESNQPFELDDRFSIVFNGEIYNYLELRSELVKLGYSFKTEGDTEVLLRSYQHWGENCVERFNGMWAFSIYDKFKQNLFCSRDRFGVKPFNYAYVNGQFIFSSEIKSILAYFPELKVPNFNVIANYCRSSIGAQIKDTWFENIYRLEPAHNLLFDLTNGVQIKRYWDYPKTTNRKITFEEAKETYKNLFASAVSLRMRSDVPVGFTLSSGIDSSSIVSILRGGLDKNNKTYTADFSNSEFKRSEKQNFRNNIEINEPMLVQKLANQFDLCPTLVEVDYNDYVNKLSKIIYHMESGHGSPAVFPLDSILEVAHKEVTVVLEGQGADELLGGYISSVQPVFILELLKKFKFRSALSEYMNFKKNYSIKAAILLFVRGSNVGWFSKVFYKLNRIDDFYSGKIKKYRHIKDFPLEPQQFDNKLNEHLFQAHTGGLVNLLHYGDAVSMKHSLESRLPFMDFRLVNFVFSLPSEFKIRNGVGKYLHREAMKEIVPEFILNNPIKFGFDSPLLHLFSNEDPNSASSVLLSEKCLQRGLFNENAIRKALNVQKEGGKNYSRYLYRMLSVELWFREFID